MATVTFDTLEFVKTLESAGIPKNQAEAISTAVGKVQDAADVATKGDIHGLKGDIRVLEAKLDLIKWLIGFLMAGMISLLVKTFF